MKRKYITKSLFFSLLIALAHIAQAQCGNNVNHWESAVLDNTTWKYKAPTGPVSGWTLPTFNDASWSSGIGGMGFGDGDDNTLIPTSNVSVYMRKSFNIIDTSQIAYAIFCMDYDDGYVAYLNGVEIARSNMNPNPAWNDFATADHEARIYQGLQPDYVTLNPSAIDTLLKNGINVLTVEVHNLTAGSSDITSRPFLQLGILNTSTNYSPVPAWFSAPMTLQTKVPIMSINTLGQTIMDDPRIICDMGIIYNGPGAWNCITDPFNNYNGKISLEYRGSSSQGFPKKPYGFSTVDAAGNDLDASLLGMPQEHDWVLLNPYTDKTFMRDVLIYNLGAALNWYASRTQFVELIINGQYQGVYVLLEKIKRDGDRVDIEKIDSTMNTGDALTGGYIFKVDKITGNSGNWWGTTQGVSIQHHDPNWDEVTPAQHTYLENYINNFENVLWSANSNDPNTGYRKYANVYSFVDFFILNEISNNIDGYRLSTFIHKDRDSKCGRFTMGPLWDFNLSFGNGDYCNGYPYTGWQMYQGCGDGSSKWVNRMLQDQWFKNLLNCRWNELRSSTLSTGNLLARVDTIANYLRAASVRDSTLWQTIGNYVWPNGWVANSWQGEIDSMKLWINNRMNWIDANMYPSTQACNTSANMSLVIDEINFHSDLSTDAGDWLELYNYGSTTLNLSNAVILDGDQYEQYCVIPNNTTLAPGARLVVCADLTKFNSKFPGVTNKIGPLCFNLSNSGQKIVIRDKDNKLITSVNYYDTWQCVTDGNGRTLQLVSTTANPNLNTSWYAGCMGGSPGVAYTPCVENTIYSELNYNSATTADAGDWVEIFNKNSVPVSLSGWKLRDGSDNNVFTFPSGTMLGAQQYVVLYSDAVKFNGQHPLVSNKIGPLGFGLNATGDVVRLFDQNDILRYSVCFGVTSPWPTSPNGLGRTLENSQYNGNHNAASSWFGGCLGGTPGYAYDPNCIPLATNDLDALDELINAYPNPTTGVLYINSNVSLQEIKLLNGMGQTIFSTQHAVYEIDMNQFPSGIYFLHCIGKNQNHILKIVKQ
ncbi:MAG: CotH kinase family protein [Chitinophagaceae bacterium]|nr:CotH kinase family protein [Chitinophagaceae bacterium]